MGIDALGLVALRLDGGAPALGALSTFAGSVLGRPGPPRVLVDRLLLGLRTRLLLLGGADLAVGDGGVTVGLGTARLRLDSPPPGEDREVTGELRKERIEADDARKRR